MTRIREHLREWRRRRRHQTGDAQAVERWLHELRASYPEYTPPAEAIGMTTRNELCFVESFARDMYSGEGTIVDLGCWFGATTAALGRGLQANTHSAGKRQVEAFDLFVWEPWMTRHTPRLERLGRRYEVGDSFLADVEDLLRPYTDVVKLERRDLLQPQPPGEPIEFLFVDAQKSWALGQSIAKGFFPRLIPGTSYVVQQDFVWYDPTILSIHLLMWYMRDHFEFVHQVPGSCSAAFRCLLPIDPSIELPPPQHFDAEMICEAYDWCSQFAESDRVVYIEGAKLLFLLERGFTDAAVEYSAEFLGGDERLPADLSAGLHRALSRYRQRPELAKKEDALRAIERRLPAAV